MNFSGIPFPIRQTKEVTFFLFPLQDKKFIPTASKQFFSASVLNHWGFFSSFFSIMVDQTVTTVLWTNSAVRGQMPFIDLCNPACLHMPAYPPYRLIYKKCDAFACAKRLDILFFCPWITSVSVANEILKLCFHLKRKNPQPLPWIFLFSNSSHCFLKPNFGASPAAVFLFK